MVQCHNEYSVPIKTRGQNYIQGSQ